MSIKAMQYALEVLENFVEDPRCEAHRIAAVHFLKQGIAEAEKQKPVDETAKDRHKTDCKKDFDLLFEANSADIEALQDAQFTLEAIKSADPGTHDEIIDASLHLIKLALSNSVFGPIERIAERYGVEI